MSAKDIDDVIRSLNQLIDNHKRWGAAYAVRAAAWNEKGKELGSLEDLRRAIADVDTARSILSDSPLIMAMALSILIDGVEIAQAENSRQDVQKWRETGEEICRKLEERPDGSIGRRELALFRHVTGQIPMTLERMEEYQLIWHLNTSPFGAVWTWMRKQDASKLRELEEELRRQPFDFEALLGLSLILVEKSEDGRKEAMDIFRKLQQMNTLPSAKVLAVHIALFLGEVEEATKASQRLLDSDEFVYERRELKNMARYHAGRITEEE